MITKVKANKQLVAWCDDCKTWTRIEELGLCPMECERLSGSPRWQRKRLMYVCEECLCAYFEQAAYEEHTCHDCY